MATLTGVINNLADWYRIRSTTAKGLIVTITTYSFIAVSFFMVRLVISGKSSDLMAPFVRSNELIASDIRTNSIPVLGATAYARVFHLQNEVIDLRRQHHYKVAMMFLKNYYGVVVSLIIITCLGGLLLFVLVNQGWAGSSYSIKALFLSLAAAAVFFSIFSSVFSQQTNFEQNMLRFMNYSKAQMNMAEQGSLISKGNFQTKKVPRLNIDTLKVPASERTVDVIDSQAYYRLLDTLIAVNNQLINQYTDYIMTIDQSKIGDISQVYQSLLKFKNATNAIDTANRSRSTKQ